MWKELPKPLMSKFGFQGCLASLELNGEMIDPLKVKYFLMNFLFFNNTGILLMLYSFFYEVIKLNLWSKL